MNVLNIFLGGYTVTTTESSYMISEFIRVPYEDPRFAWITSLMVDAYGNVIL